MSSGDDREEVAREVWRLMSDLVLDNQRRREVADAAGMSFGRTRTVRRVAHRPMSMGGLATVLGMERPNVTALVNDLEDQGLVQRRADPADRRTRLVEATAEGKKIARRADEILNTPPAALTGLGLDDLEVLREILASSSD